MHMAVAILRVEKGLDYSRVLSEDKEKPIEEPRIIQMNDSTTDLLDNSQIHGSNESLSRNNSQGKIEHEQRIHMQYYHILECRTGRINFER